MIKLISVSAIFLGLILSCGLTSRNSTPQSKFSSTILNESITDGDSIKVLIRNHSSDSIFIPIDKYGKGTNPHIKLNKESSLYPYYRITSNTGEYASLTFEVNLHGMTSYSNKQIKDRVSNLDEILLLAPLSEKIINLPFKLQEPQPYEKTSIMGYKLNDSLNYSLKLRWNNSCSFVNSYLNKKSLDYLKELGYICLDFDIESNSISIIK